MLNKTSCCIEHKLVVTFGDLKEITCKQQNTRIPKHKTHGTTQDVQNENWQNWQKMQSKKYNVLKSQITKSDLKSHNKGLYPKLEKVWTYPH